MMEQIKIDATQSPIFKDAINESCIQFQQFKNEIKKIIIGQESIIEFIIIALLCNGHILLEGVPGVAKTTTIKTITEILGLNFKRIQFTPDLLPSDLIGTLIYNQKTGDFETKKGPIFANLILADEINRAPAKVQAALLEAMQEQQVTIGSETFSLEYPFLVFATQNPIENEGTYRLPEAQVDRFMFKLIMGYPTPDQEKKIITSSFENKQLCRVMNYSEIIHAQNLVKQIYIDDLVVDYIVRIVDATRNPARHKLTELSKYITHGASPRATIALYQASRAYAFLHKRHFVTPDDVKAVCSSILHHRIITSFIAETENVTSQAIIKIIINTLATP